MLKDKLCFSLLHRNYLQKETISQGPGMLHKPKTLVHRNMSEHVTCLFLRFVYTQNYGQGFIMPEVGHMARTDIAGREAKRELNY